MTTVLRASSPAEFLGIVPSLAGFTPTQSIVLLPFHGSRTYGAMRIDLPRPDIAPEDFARHAIGLVSKVDGADAIAIVVYTDEDPLRTSDGLVLPLSVQVDELIGCADDAGHRIVDALCVTPGGWSSYLDDEPVLEPLPATDADAGDQHAGVELPAVEFVDKEHVGRALRDIDVLFDRERRGLLDGTEDPQAITALALLEHVPCFFEMLLEHPDDQSPSVTAALLWCLNRPLLRDVALAQWASSLADGIRTLEAQCAFADGRGAIPEDLGSVFLGQGPTPDPDRLQLALSAVRLAAARAPRMARPAPLTAAAWLSWALGRSTHAEHYLQLVREIDPEYGLAALLSTIVGAGMLPDWTFRRGPGLGR
ncbi:MAG: DUF4192 family protein [Microbacterium sp.]